MTVRGRLFVGLAFAVGSLVLSSAPAFAVEGKGVAMTEVVLQTEGLTVRCAAEGIGIIYKILSAAKEAEPKWEEQVESNPGKGLAVYLGLGESKECKAEIEGIKTVVQASSCEVHLEDTSTKSTNEVPALFSVLSSCIAKLKAIGCEAKMVRGKESEKINSSLKEVFLKNVGTENLNGKFTVEGLTMESNCAGVEAKSKTAKMTTELLFMGVIHL